MDAFDLRFVIGACFPCDLQRKSSNYCGAVLLHRKGLAKWHINTAGKTYSYSWTFFYFISVSVHEAGIFMSYLMMPWYNIWEVLPAWKVLISRQRPKKRFFKWRHKVIVNSYPKIHDLNMQTDTYNSNNHAIFNVKL